jgi:hypothetical protein
MKRRAFIALIGGAVAWPLVARAQQPERMRRIGVLMPFAADNLDLGQARFAALREGLEKLGWTEGRNIRIDTRWTTTGDVESMQRFAKELVALQPDLILTQSTPITATLLQETRTIPIVFALVADPIGSGFASFPQPGGNVTGFVTMEPTMAGKWLELLKEIAPRVAQVAMLFNPATATYFLAEPVQSRRCLVRSGGDRSTCSRQVRARSRHCRTGTRAEWWPDRDAGYLHRCPSRRDHISGGPLPPPGRLSVSSIHCSRWPAVLWR